MKKIVCLLFALISFGLLQAQVSAIVGQWITIDDKSGIKKSIVQIYKGSDGLYYGKVLKILEERYAGALCEPCKGEDKNKPVEGMLVIRGMKADGNQLSGGTILDPETGNTYYCKISYDPNSKKLTLRGSLDKRGLFGRNQTWIKK